MADEPEDGWGETLQDGRLVAPSARVVPFASSDEFFAWLRHHLTEEGQLTLAEEEICGLLLLGRNYLEIATARDVAVETIKWHVKRILRKLDVDSAREMLVVIGYRIDQGH